MDKEEKSTLVDLCQDVFVGGKETTSATSNFVIVHLLKQPLVAGGAVAGNFDSIQRRRSVHGQPGKTSKAGGNNPRDPEV